METINDYLKKTESATQKLFEAINSYIKILHSVETPVFVTETTNDEERNKEYEVWSFENEARIKASIGAQERFVDELFAMSTLCGSLLQIAAMGIQKYSNNKEIPDKLSAFIKPETKQAKFCIGRLVREIPIGLIIYAGRNQYSHFDDKDLLEPNKTIFKRLCLIESFTTKGTFYADPAFDLTNDNVIIFADNITALLGWRDYKSYVNDMVEMLR